MAADPNGLSSVEQIEALADQLSACADTLHARIMKSINDKNGGSEADLAAARALLGDEQVLRERANGLYADAATCVVKTLGKPQAHVMALTAAAAEKIRKIQTIGDATSLVAGLLGLAAAVGTGQPLPILGALQVVGAELKAVKADLPKKPG